MSHSLTSNPKPKRQELDSFMRGRIIGQWEKDATYSEISTSLDIPISTVGNDIKVIRDKGTSVPSKRLGATPKVTKRTQAAMFRSFRKEPFVSIAVQHQRLVDEGISMSMVTFRKNMKLPGYGSHVPVRKPGMTERHKENQLKWCQDKVNWTVDQWKSVVWPDESRFLVIGNDGSIRVIRKKGERYADGNMVSTYKFGKGSVMVWGCFWGGGLGPLVTLKGNIDQDKYVDCLAEHFLPWYEELARDTNRQFLFQ